MVVRIGFIIDDDPILGRGDVLHLHRSTGLGRWRSKSGFLDPQWATCHSRGERKRKTRIHRIMDIVFFVISTRVLDDESPVAESG